MSNVKISELPAASSAGAGDQLPANQAGTTRRVTSLQIANYVRDLAGTVRQVVSASHTTQTTISTTTWTDTGLIASITPGTASNKVLVIASVPMSVAAEKVGAFGGLRLVRGASTVILTPVQDGQGPYEFSLNAIGSGTTYVEMFGRITLVKLDSPSSSSSISYKVQGRPYDATANETLTTCPDSGEATITLVEIAA